MVNSHELSESSDDDQLSTFLARFSTQLHYSKCLLYSSFSVFWSQNERSQNNSSSDNPGLLSKLPDPWVIPEKIKSAFSRPWWVDHGLLQFWAPVTTGGRRLLTASDQPFGLPLDDDLAAEHRLCSVKYQYNVDVNKHQSEEDPMIIAGAPATAFLSHFPELVLDLSVHHGHPLMRSAWECEFPCSIVMPICDPSQRCCVGVVECLMFLSDYDVSFFKSLKDALEAEGLSMFRARQHLSFKTIHGLEHPRDEITKALKIVCEAYYISIAQVWIPYEDTNHVALSSSMEDTPMNQVLALKLVDYVVYSNDEDLNVGFVAYLDVSDTFPLKMGERLVGKTLQNHEPHFCIDISLLSSNVEVLAPLIQCYDTKLSCFAICLTSIDIGDFNYVFEFLWIKRENYEILLDSLINTLKRCLPNFKLASGAELGDELRVTNIEKSLENEAGFFKICEGIRSSPIPKAPEEETRPLIEKSIMPEKVKGKTAPISLPRETIEQQFGRTGKEAARNLKVSESTLKRKCKEAGITEWQGPKFGKRKVNKSHNNHADTNEEDKGANQDPSVVNMETNSDESNLTVKAEYEADTIKFRLPISLTTLVAIKEEIGKRFELNHGTYKLKYRDEDGELILMTCDQDMRECIKSSRSPNNTTIRLVVV